MKSLFVYYSYTGNNREFSKELAAFAGGDVVEIRDWLLRLPLWALYFIGGMFGSLGIRTYIQHAEIKPEVYDRIILSCPVWGWKLVPAMKTFIEKYRKHAVKFSLCLVCGGGEKYRNLIHHDFVKSAGCEPKKLLVLSEKEFARNNYAGQLKEFFNK